MEREAFEHNSPLRNDVAARVDGFERARGLVAEMAITSRTYSITSSARARSVGGMVRLSPRAVLRLMRNSNLVGCSIGTSAGLAPLRILSACVATRWKAALRSGP